MPRVALFLKKGRVLSLYVLKLQTYFGRTSSAWFGALLHLVHGKNILGNVYMDRESHAVPECT